MPQEKVDGGAVALGGRENRVKCLVGPPPLSPSPLKSLRKVGFRHRQTVKACIALGAFGAISCCGPTELCPVPSCRPMQATSKVACRRSAPFGQTLEKTFLVGY